MIQGIARYIGEVKNFSQWFANNADVWLNDVSDEIYVSLMSQYFPAYKAVDDEIIKRRLNSDEFQHAVDAFHEAGLKNGYIQNYTYESV